MSSRVDSASSALYRYLWRTLAPFFKVPLEPPRLPVGAGERHDSFQPALGYLRYLKCLFWLALAISDLPVFVIWIAATAALLSYGHWIIALLIIIPALSFLFLPDIFVFVGIHLRFDTTWYVLTDRSVRIRRGIWIIREMTVTFENVQDVTVKQGPLQRYFGIASVIINTAGGGGGGGPHHHHDSSHQAVIEGITNAAEIRDLIMERVKASTSAGLGDEHPGAARTGASAGSPRPWSAEEIAALREIRDEIARIGASPA